MIQNVYLLTFERQEQVHILTYLTYLYLGTIPWYFGRPDKDLFDDTAYFLLSLPDLSEFGFYLGPLWTHYGQMS